MSTALPPLISPVVAMPRTAEGPPRAPLRVTVRGKFLFLGEAKFHLRGVTYGPFRPTADGCEYHTPELVERDFRRMAEAGLNSVRVYTVPPRWLLDIAARHGLRVMIGLPWEQHVTFLDDAKRAADIVERVRKGVRECAGHPALLAYAVGNEIPAPIVRWHGHRKVEGFIRRLFDAVKAEDPAALVTYVNYPSTEYLYLPFLDFTCFNVYLESRDRLEAYLARLQNVAGDRPLVMAEIGLDSLRNGDAQQGRTLEWQIQSVFAAGCAGTFVFAWTDEWHRGGHDIDDWKFGLTTVDRAAKPALEVVARAFADTPFPMDRAWPRVSVVVCSHDGARTIRRTMEGLARLEYPNYEVIVVDDRSTDDTVKIAREFDAKTLQTAPGDGGLSAARNLGLANATGEIIAYIDDDAFPDEHWLMYLADAFAHSGHAAVGGPNIAPEGAGLVARCVSRSPGGPTHVLLTDREAEHLPGCNIAFRTERLRAIGGFDVQFRVAGDDVDVCWRIRERGWTLGFTAGAMVWHLRRDRVGRFWRQQFHYGAAEGQLERKWPQHYAAGGRIAWAGRLYAQGAAHVFGRGRRRIFHGVWGSAMFQSVYEGAAGFWESFGLMPEWYLLVVAVGAATAAGIAWRPLVWAAPVFALAAAVPVVQAMLGARRQLRAEAGGGGGAFALTALLHLMQPAARALGQARRGGGVARMFRPARLAVARRELAAGEKVSTSRSAGGATVSVWHEAWRGGEERLEMLERDLRAGGAVVVRGGPYDRWDLEVRGGGIGSARVRLTTEEHGAGKQMVRYRVWDRWAGIAVAGVVGLVVAAAACGGVRAWVACAASGGGAVLVAVRARLQAVRAARRVRAALGDVAC